MCVINTDCCYPAHTMIVVCDISALRINDRFPRSLLPCSSNDPIVPTLTEQDLTILDLASFNRSVGDLHAIVPSKCERRHPRGIISHVCSTPLPPSSIETVKPAVGVASIALTAVLMSRTMDDYSLIRFLYELCATHRVEDYRTRHKPLASVDMLKSELGRLGCIRGSKRILELLDFVADNSASPRETDLAMLAWLPHHLGGYGLPMGEMNRTIGVGGSDRRCDLLFRKQKVGVEYDSDEAHAGRENIARDSARRKVLENGGYRVVPITNGEFSDRELSFEAMRLVGKCLGSRVRKPRGAEAVARERLFRFVCSMHVPFF